MANKFFQFEPEKALNIILFVANRVSDPTFHRISKVIYFADKLHLQRYGRLICGDSYFAMQHGPVPSEIYDILKDVRGDGYSKHREIAQGSFEVRAKATVVPLKDADLGILSESDQECLTDSIREYGRLSFTELTRLSHDQAWKSVDENDIIDLEEIVATLPDGSVLLDHLHQP